MPGSQRQGAGVLLSAAPAPAEQIRHAFAQLTSRQRSIAALKRCATALGFAVMPTPTPA